MPDRYSQDSIMEKSIIVAIADNNAIGRNNELLWHISEDLKFFKRTTLGCPVIMGRKTFESIGRPHPKRLNIVVSRSGYEAPEGVRVVASLEEAFGLAGVEILRSAQNDKESAQNDKEPAQNDKEHAQNDKEPAQNDKHNVMPSEVETSASRVFVIGGGQIYAQAISQVDSMVITHVHTVIEDADTFFPAIDPSVWAAAERSELQTDPETGYTFEFVKYVKR